jgi:hypothetical protein
MQKKLDKNEFIMTTLSREELESLFIVCLKAFYRFNLKELLDKHSAKQNKECVDLYPWHKAPEWAKYAATDRDGQMWWFEKRPKIHGAEWAHGFDNCRVERINLECPEFAETLESRPDNI